MESHPHHERHAEALRWLAGSLAWERTLAALRAPAPARGPIIGRRPVPGSLPVDRVA